jgi:hypothetical protein
MKISADCAVTMSRETRGVAFRPPLEATTTGVLSLETRSPPSRAETVVALMARAVAQANAIVMVRVMLNFLC